MANADRPTGLMPLEYLNGSPWNGACRMYCIPNTDDTNAYAIGDPVVLAGGADANGVATVTLATAGTASLVLGAIVGFGSSKYGGSGMPGDTESTVIPATKSKDYYVLVADDPNIVFEIQEVSGGTALTAAEVGLNANFAAAGTNNGYTSTWELDNSGEATGATLQLKLLGLVQRADNAFGEHAKWRVLINHHQYRAGVAGV